MAEKKEAPKEIKIQELKQKQNILNLDTGVEDEILVVTKRYIVPDGMDEKAAFAAAEKIVSPLSKRTEALLAFATSQSYAESKAAALAKGNYMSAQLKSALMDVMNSIPAFAEIGARECWKRWIANYRGTVPEGESELSMEEKKRRKALAVKLLDRAKANLEATEFDSF